MVDRSSGSRPGSTSESALAHLRWAGLDDISSAVPIDGGWASWTYLVDEVLIARFPRTDEVAASHDRERALLPELAGWVGFSVPVPFEDVRVAMVYEVIRGWELPHAWTPQHLRSVSDVIHELHGFPVDRAVELLGRHDHDSVARARFEEVALPIVSLDLADLVRAELDRAAAAPRTWTPCLVHGDLGPEHVLWETDHLLAGLIDFEDAHVGDPASDLVLLDEWTGHADREELLAGHDLGDDVEERLWRIGWTAVLHGIAHAVEEDDGETARAMARDLRRRLSAGPRR